MTGEHPVVSPPPPPAPEIAAPPRTPSPSGLLELNPTLETVERLWDADVPAPLEEWEPSEFVEPPRIDTSFLVTGALILFAVFALWTAVSELTARQDARLDALHADTVALADLTASLASGGAEERLGEVDTYARSVFSRADDLDLGNPDRALAIEAAGSALDLERALGDAFSYRSAFEAVVERPALPTSGEPERASAAAETLVMWATAISDVVDGAPALGELADHRTEGAAFQETLAAVQQRYLDALRDRDAGAAAAALVELDEAVGRLSAGVQPAVEAVVDRAPAVASEIRRAAGRMSVASES